MFGKNDDMVDQSYQHSATPAQDTSFGSASGDDFMSAPSPTMQAAPAAQEAPSLEFPQTEAPTFAAPPQPVQYDEPAAPAPATVAAEEPAPQSYAPAAPAEEMPPVPDSLSFSARFGNQQAPAVPQPEPSVSVVTGEDEIIGEGAPVGVAPETLLTEQNEVAEPYTQTPDFRQIAGESASTVGDASIDMEVPAEDVNAFEKTTAALNHPDVQSAGGKTRIQAVALGSLIGRAQGSDEQALAQLQTHGFELLEKLADGLAPGSAGLNNLVDAAAALIDEGVVQVVNGPAPQQQTEKMEEVAVPAMDESNPLLGGAPAPVAPATAEPAAQPQAQPEATSVEEAFPAIDESNPLLGTGEDPQSFTSREGQRAGVPPLSGGMGM